MDSIDTLVQDRIALKRRSPITAERSREGSLLHGRYRLRERLGAGGFGVVWRAQDEILRREVALKRIPLPQTPPCGGAEDGFGAEDGRRGGEHQPGTPADGRANREALAAARLAHPAIVALYEAYVEADAFYLVSELVHGQTLATLLAARALSDVQLLRIGLALGQALAHAHDRGVVHRDVKPQNVLVPHDAGSHGAPAKLTDFGGASLSGLDALTRSGETLGTLAYMAPEQSEGLPVDERTDLYSLALVLYEGLTGANPVRGPTPAATARRIGQPLPPIAASRPDLPCALADALDTALAIDPGRRGTLAELQGALERTLADDHASAADPRTLPAPRARQSAPPSHPSDLEPHAERYPAAGPPPEPAEPAQDSQRTFPRSLPLPRAVWAGCALAGAVWLTASARPGAALLLLAAAAPLALAGPRPGAGWLAAGLAPLLGVAGLAGAYPALAGQASRWRRRAMLGALGYWWLILAEPLLDGTHGSRLWLGPPAGLPARASWEGSLQSAAVHVLAPALSAGVLLGAILWAAGAATLPWIVRGRGALFDTLAAIAWSATLLAAAPYLDAGLSAAGGVPHPRGAVLAAILGAAVAVAARALRGPVSATHP